MAQAPRGLRCADLPRVLDKLGLSRPQHEKATDH